MAETSVTLALRHLSDACRDHLVREKIVVAPSLAIGHQIADAIAQGGPSWVNLRIETVRTIADAVAGFDLAQSGLAIGRSMNRRTSRRLQDGRDSIGRSSGRSTICGMRVSGRML